MDKTINNPGPWHEIKRIDSNSPLSPKYKQLALSLVLNTRVLGEKKCEHSDGCDKKTDVEFEDIPSKLVTKDGDIIDLPNEMALDMADHLDLSAEEARAVLAYRQKISLCMDHFLEMHPKIFGKQSA